MKKTRKIGIFRIIVMLAVCIAILALVSLAIIQGGKFSLKNLLRGIRGEYADEFYYDNAANGAFAPINGGLCVLTGSRLTVFDPYGEESISRFVALSSPALNTAGKYGAAYDIGGKSLMFFSSSGVIEELETESPIVSAAVNEKGYLSVCTEETGWGGSVTVYNSGGSAVYKWYSGSSRILSASVRGKKDLFVLSLGKDGSSLVRLSLDSEDEQARYTYNGLIYDACLTGENIAAVTGTSVLFLNDSLEVCGEYDLDGLFLAFYDFSGDNPVLVTGESPLSAERNLTVLNSSGDELYTVSAAGQVQDISAAGKYLAVLYNNGSAAVYNPDMSEYASYNGVSGYEAIIAREDGSAVAAGIYSAQVFSPEKEE